MKYQQTSTNSGAKTAASFYQGTLNNSNAKAMAAGAYAQKQTKAILLQHRNVSSAHAQNSKPCTRYPMPPCDPDIGFYSGAWLFDESCAPLWLLTQIPRHQRSISNNSQSYLPNPFVPKSHSKVSSKPKSHVNRYFTEIQNWTPDVSFASGSWLFSMDNAPVWLKKALSDDPTPQASIDELNNIKRVFQKAKSPPKAARTQSSSMTRQQKGHFEIRNYSPEDAITSGAWLFDIESTPEWFQLLVGTPFNAVSSRKPQYQSAKPSVTRRVAQRKRLITPQTSQELFESGAWLFDATSCPSWLISQAPEVCTSRPSRSARSFKTQSQATSFYQQSNPASGYAASRPFTAKSQQGVGKNVFNSNKAFSSLPQNRSQKPVLPPYQESEAKTRSNARETLQRHQQARNEKQCSQITKTNVDSTFSGRLNHNECTKNNHNCGQACKNYQNCSVAPASQWGNQVCSSNRQNTVPTASGNKTGVGHGAFSIETKSLGHKATRSQSARPPKTVSEQNFDDITDDESMNWMYFGEMRPNKVYLGRTKQSKSASKEKKPKCYF